MLCGFLLHVQVLMLGIFEPLSQGWKLGEGEVGQGGSPMLLSLMSA